MTTTTRAAANRPMSAPNVPLVLMTVLWKILLSVVAPSLVCEVSVLIGGCLLLVVIFVTGITPLVSVKGRHLTPTSIEWAQDDCVIMRLQSLVSVSVVWQVTLYTGPAPSPKEWAVASIIIIRIQGLNYWNMYL